MHKDNLGQFVPVEKLSVPKSLQGKDPEYSNEKEKTLASASSCWFKCLNCKFKSKFESELKDHLSSCSKVKLFKCILERQILPQSKIKPFKCSKCNYECIAKSQLTDHILKHNRIKRFKCSECSNQYTTKGNLKRHLLTHNGIK
ncbi:UNVERIFIED_CONTAM: hypothetical protein GTU68_023779 [Idotea baltica]|nr:hypothetical protein [Idotea baltica]